MSSGKGSISEVDLTLSSEIKRLQEENAALKEQLSAHEATKRQLASALERLAELEEKQYNTDQARRTEEKLQELQSRSEEGATDAPGGDSKSELERVDSATLEAQEHELEIAHDLSFVPPSPPHQKLLDEKVEHIGRFDKRLKAMERRSTELCENCGKMANSCREFALSIRSFLAFDGAPALLRECGEAGVNVISRMGEFLLNFKMQVQEIFNKDIHTMKDRVKDLQNHSRELKRLCSHFDHSLSSFVSRSEEQRSVATGGSGSQKTKAKPARTIVSFFTGGLAGGKRRAAAQSASGSAVAAGSSKHAVSGLMAENPPSIRDGAQLAREQYELHRFDHICRVNTFLNEAVVDFTESCVALFTFTQMFFKNGYHECTSLERKIMINRLNVNRYRAYFAKTADEAKASRARLARNLADQPFYSSRMDDIYKGVRGGEDLPVVSADASARLMEKSGYLHKLGAGFSKSWRRRWFLIQDGDLYYMRDKTDLQLNFVANLVISSIKECGFKERPHAFVIINPQNSREYTLQAPSEAEMKEWVRALRLVGERKLYEKQRGVSGDADAGADAGAGFSKSKAFEQIRKLNPKCADCGADKPEWAVINLGVCVCIRCSGVHRSLSVRISKVRSLRLDSWSPSTLSLMCRVGSRRLNAIYEAKPNPLFPKLMPESDGTLRRAYIREKYLNRGFVAKLQANNDDKSEAKNDTKVSSSAAPDATGGVQPVDNTAAILEASENSSDAEARAQTLLLTAVKNDDIEGVLRAIASGAHLNTKSPNGGDTALHVAAASNATDVIEFLLLNGSNMRAENDKGEIAQAVAKANGSMAAENRLDKALKRQRFSSVSSR